MEVRKQFGQLPGRVDALGPPSQDHPKPAPPIWLSQALLRLQQAYPDDAFEATMRYTPVSTTTDLPISLHSTESAPPDTKYVYFPRIKCLECPGKLYSPGPDLGARYFEMHLKHKVHREKVWKKLGKTMQLSSSPKPEPNEPGTVRLNGRTMPIKALPATSRDYDDSGEQKVSPSREPLGSRESKRCSHSVTGAENLEAPVNDVEKLNKKLGKPARLSSAREPAFDEPGTRPQVSSYWSVLDQTDFYNLVRYFGTNWEAVADIMKTKTHVMIENYYHRKIQEGDSGQQLKEEVHRADALRASGANMGPMPAPAVVGNKKRCLYNPLKQKTTGTSRTEGIGFCVAAAAIEHSAHVCISGSKQDKLERAISRLQSTYPDSASKVSGHICDLSQPDSLEPNLNTVLKLATAHSKIDHIIFTSGDSFKLTPIAEVTIETILKAGNVRFMGPLMLAKLAPKYMSAGPKSSITLTGGTMSQKPAKNWTVMAAWGSGIEGITRGLAIGLAPIRVNMVCPGAVHTEILDKYPKESLDSVLQGFREGTLIGKVGTPENVVEAYLYPMKDQLVTGEFP